MGLRVGFVLLWALLSVSMHSDAQSASSSVLPGMLVSGDWLQGRLGSPDLLILHVGADADYQSGHLPGAVLVKLSDVSVTSDSGLRLELPSPEALATALGALGVSNQRAVVIYHGTDSVQSATRVWFTFDFLGLGSQAALLDGGLAVWKREGRPISTDAALATPATVQVSPRPEAVASLDWMRQNADHKDHLLLDARLPQFFSGAEMGIATRLGHIPGAANVPYLSFLDQQGRWKSADALRLLLFPTGQPRRVVLSYCHIGQQATVPYFAARMLGMEARMFDGSFQAWSREAELPVEQAP
ncbi:MAG: rhodanese-like domain-containing protein [Bryobacterales bacterium]|nr:rhodanese-like domain-containing protein [Bryobacterales bacterium]